MSQIIYLST